MKLLPYSNSFHKGRKKLNIKPMDLIKRICILLIILLVFGFLYEFIIKKVQDGNMPETYKYVRLDNTFKYHYQTVGKGDVTLIFDGDLGVGKEEWQKVASAIEKQNLNCRMFFYDRAGYGQNDGGTQKSPKVQADDLRMILKKIGLNGKVILVGEGYGSLVLSNFAKLYPQYVEGMVLVNPINESQFKDSDFLKEYKSQKIMRKIEDIGSSFALTRLLNNFNLLKDPTGFLENISEKDKELYKILRSRSNYTTAYYNELQNIIKGDSNSQIEGLINDKPLSIIANKNKFLDRQNELSKLSNAKDLLEMKEIDQNTDIAALEESDEIVLSIKQMLKKYKMLNGENK